MARQRDSTLKNSAILLLRCPNRKGLDAAIADFIYWHGGDILHFEQHQPGVERFYLARVEWDLTGFEFDLKDFPKWFAPIAQEFSISMAHYYIEPPPSRRDFRFEI